MHDLCVKLEVLKLVLMAKKEFHVLKIACGCEGMIVEETTTLDK